MLFFVNVSQPKFINDLIIIKVDDTRKIIIIYHIDRKTNPETQNLKLIFSGPTNY